MIFSRTIECPDCGAKNQKDANHCGSCGVRLAGRALRCGKCGEENRGDAKYCGKCGAPMDHATAPAMRGSRWMRGENDYTIRIEVDDLNDLVRRGLVVEPGTNALLIKDGATQGTLPPGSYTMDTLPRRVHGWLSGGKVGPVTALLVDIVPTEFVFKFDRLFTKDPIELDLTVRLMAEVDSPGKFLTNMLRGRERYTLEDLRNYLSPEVEQAAAAWLRRHTLQEISENLTLSDDFELEVAEKLRKTFVQSGLRFENIRTMEVGLDDQVSGIHSRYTLEAAEVKTEAEGRKTLGEALKELDIQQLAADTRTVELEESRAELYGRMRQVMLSNRMDQVRSKAEFETFLDDMDHQTMLHEKERKDLPGNLLKSRKDTTLRKPASLDDIPLDDLKREKVRLDQRERTMISEIQDIETEKRKLFEEGVRNNIQREQRIIARHIKELDQRAQNMDRMLQTISKQMRILSGQVTLKERSRIMAESGIASVLKTIDLQDLVVLIDLASVDGEFQEEKFDDLLRALEGSGAHTPEISEDEDVLQIMREMQMASEAADSPETVEERLKEMERATLKTQGEIDETRLDNEIALARKGADFEIEPCERLTLTELDLQREKDQFADARARAQLDLQELQWQQEHAQETEEAQLAMDILAKMKEIKRLDEEEIRCIAREDELARKKADFDMGMERFQLQREERIEKHDHSFTEIEVLGDMALIPTTIQNGKVVVQTKSTDEKTCPRCCRRTTGDTPFCPNCGNKLNGMGVAIDLIDFSITAPQCLQPSRSYVLDVWAHLPALREEIIQRARQSLVGEPRTHTRSGVEVARGAALKVRLRLPGFVIEEPEDTILWNGSITNTSFIVNVPENIATDSHTGKVIIYQNELQIARLNFALQVGPQELPAEVAPAEVDWIQSAFASYAHADRDEVFRRAQGIQKGNPGLDLFLDVVSLRSGDAWEKRITEEILRRDVFFLFWSQAASQSSHVEKEWRAALAQKGIDAIDPVPLESPDEVPPPHELASLHFNDTWLALING
jgi:membrane protease subunit (stomatin/prohibitin family)